MKATILFREIVHPCFATAEDQKNKVLKLSKRSQKSLGGNEVVVSHCNNCVSPCFATPGNNRIDDSDVSFIACIQVIKSLYGR